MRLILAAIILCCPFSGKDKQYSYKETRNIAEASFVCGKIVATKQIVLGRADEDKVKLIDALGEQIGCTAVKAFIANSDVTGDK